MHRCALQVCCTPMVHLECCCCFKVLTSVFPLSLVLNFIRTEQHNQFITTEFATYCFSAVGQCFRASCAFVEWNKGITTFTWFIISFSVVIAVTLPILTYCCRFCALCLVPLSFLLVLAFQLLLLSCLLLWVHCQQSSFTDSFLFISCLSVFAFWVCRCLFCLCSSWWATTSSCTSQVWSLIFLWGV